MKSIKLAMMLTMILGVLLLSAAAQPKQVKHPKRVRVQVNGMACPFCAYNVEKRLRTLPAVGPNAKIDISVKKGTATFDWKAGAAVDKDAIRKQIRKAGFTPGKITVLTPKPVTQPATQPTTQPATQPKHAASQPTK